MPTDDPQAEGSLLARPEERGAEPSDPDVWLRDLVDQRRLSPAQRRIAHHVREHLRDVAFLSSVELAGQVGVSQPSVTRFAATLGFPGYPAFREAVRSKVLRGPEGQPGRERRSNEAQDAVRAEIKNLETLEESLADPSTVYSLARTLVAPRPLVVVGFRVGAPLARLFGHFAAKLLPDVRVFDRADSATMDGILQARRAGAAWVLGFAMPRYPTELLAGLASAREAGLQVALVADRRAPELSALADIVLTANVGSRLVFDSQAAPMVLTLVLLQAMCDVLPVEAQAQLEEFEQAAARRGLFA